MPNPELGRGVAQRWECLGFVKGLAVLQAVVNLAEEFVEQVAACRGVSVVVLAPLTVMLAGWVDAAEKAHIQPTLASGLFLMWRCVMEIERPDAQVTGADPA